MTGNFSKRILFTGAGFTKNFGGLLGSEIWYKIFNWPEIQSLPNLRELLISDYDYESIYYKVLGGEFNAQEKDAISTAIFETYETIDRIVRNWTFRRDAPYPINIYGVNRLIELFAGGNNELGFFFTLNQDLFIERHFNSIKTALIHPGVQKIPDSHKTIMKLPLENQDYISLPTEDSLQNNMLRSTSFKTINYIKLHGSFGWKSSEGINRLVIGGGKEKQIGEEPLLSWYFEIFKKALLLDERRLFVIGYGFGDEHINKIIADSAQHYGLKLFVMSPTEQSEFIKHLNAVNYGNEILSALTGYFHYKLLDLFPADQSDTHAWAEVAERFFSD